MPKVQVFDPPMCCSTGVCGPQVDPALVRFAADLEWLKSKGAEVERFNLSQGPAAFVRVEMPEGSPIDETVRIATERGVTLAVMGTTGRSSANAVYLGSVSHGVARGSPAPVLLVPPDRSASRER